tara:strand:- start:289 stop:645 length:357 start_codon:yes stop_codon:yes gene_type:complete
MQYNKAQYNNNYQKKNYNNSGNTSTGGTATLISTKQNGLILKVILDNQNLVLQGRWNNQANGFKLFPYYDKTKTNPKFNQPKQPRNEMDDQLPQSEQEWSQGSGTEFNPEEYEHQLGD